MSPTLKKIIMGLVIVLALVLVAWIFMGDESAEDDIISTGGLDTNEKIANQEFLSLLRALKQVKLSGGSALLNDPLFQTLVDFGVPLTEEPRGRSNPFAVLSLAGEARPGRVSASEGAGGASSRSTQNSASLLQTGGSVQSSVSLPSASASVGEETTGEDLYYPDDESSDEGSPAGGFAF